MSFEEKLIELVKKNEILYKRTSGGYKNVVIKFQIWHEIAMELNSTEEACERRWKSLRERFSKENKKSQLPSGSKSKLVEKWQYYEALSFLHDHVQPRSTSGNYSENTEYLSIAEEFNESEHFNESALNNESAISASNNESAISASNNIERFERNFDEEASLLSSTPSVSSTRKKRSETPDICINKKLCETMDVFKIFLQKPRVPQPNHTQKLDTNESFSKACGLILNSLQLENQIRARAEILQYLSQLQLAELENIIQN